MSKWVVPFDQRRSAINGACMSLHTEYLYNTPRARTKMSASGKHELLCILVLITQSDRGTPKCGGTEEHRQTKHPEDTSRPQFGLTFTFHAPPSPELVDPNWCRTFHRMTTRDACNIYVVQASPAFAVKPEPTPCNTPRQSDSSTFRGRACCSLQNNRHHVTCY